MNLWYFRFVFCFRRINVNSRQGFKDYLWTMRHYKCKEGTEGWAYQSPEDSIREGIAARARDWATPGNAKQPISRGIAFIFIDTICRYHTDTVDCPCGTGQITNAYPKAYTTAAKQVEHSTDNITVSIIQYMYTVLYCISSSKQCFDVDAIYFRIHTIFFY